MEVAYYTLHQRVPRDNVVSLDDYREKLLNQPRDAEYTTVEPPKELPLMPESVMERGACALDMLASVALTFGAFVSMCVVLFALL